MHSLIRNSLANASERSINILRHIGWSFVFKLGSILANFMMVPLAVAYLGAEDYGIWLTLSSVLTWFMLFDIGLGNGLRNKFAEAKALGKDDEAQAFVSTAYLAITAIGVTLVVVMWLLNFVVDWTAVFNTSAEKSTTLSTLIPICFGFFGMQLVAKLIVSIYQADQHHSIQDRVQFFGQFLALAVIWLLLQAGDNSLLVFGSVFMALPVFVLIVLNVLSFTGRFARYRPKLSLFKKHYLHDITGLGFKFFIIQIAAIVLFTTDNFIITQLFGPAEVVPYNIAFRYFSIITLGYGVLVAPFWSSFTEAYAKQDMEWIKRSVSLIQKIWMLIPLALIVMVLLADWFYRVWVGSEINVPMSLTVAMAVFFGMQTFYVVYVNFINGVGAITIQLITSVLSIVINIPVSIYFAKYMSMGIVGVILGTCVCMSYSLVLRPLQYYKIVNGKASGIWIR